MGLIGAMTIKSLNLLPFPFFISCILLKEMLRGVFPKIGQYEFDLLKSPDTNDEI